MRPQLKRAGQAVSFLPWKEFMAGLADDYGLDERTLVDREEEGDLLDWLRDAPEDDKEAAWEPSPDAHRPVLVRHAAARAATAIPTSASYGAVSIRSLI